MDAHAAREQLRQLALAQKPAGPLWCVLCHGPADHMGVGTVDDTIMAYGICLSCWTPDYAARVVRKMRRERLRRRRN